MEKGILHMNVMEIIWGPYGFYVKFLRKYVGIAWVKAVYTLCK